MMVMSGSDAEPDELAAWQGCCATCASPEITSRRIVLFRSPYGCPVKEVAAMRRPDQAQREPAMPEIPGCTTGPIGRVRFVATELSGMFRRWRGRAGERAEGGESVGRRSHTPGAGR